nr:uncharacterized protein LOC109167340 [Ipomoea batatas]
MEKKVTYPALIKAMLDCKDGGVWFKRLFMVLVCSMFIETQQNGTVGIQALYYLDDVLSIPRMNWCSFVMNVLMETSVEWLKERSEYFSDSLLFLLVFYVDRIVLFKRYLPRAFPAFIGWTSDLLKDRQNEELNNGGFCQCRIEARYVPTA